MSDTPKTDAQKRGDFVHINFARELERENAALRADIQAHEQINRQLIEDKRRLDFLGQAKSAYYYEGPCCWRINEDKDTDGDTLRAAIDAARKEAQP